MGLVGYSDSEGSDDENAPVATGGTTGKETVSKRGFQKVVDRSNSSKIRVNLPAAPTEKSEGVERDSDEPPSKKKKVSGGFMGGFNAMLPAPKRTGVSGTSSAGSTSRLQKGVSLKTSAAPGFTREPMEPMEPTSTEDDGHEERNGSEKEDPEGDHPSMPATATGAPEPKAEPPLKGKVTMFKPLSVARKPQKPKKKPTTESAPGGDPASDGPIGSNVTTTQRAKPKVSLFSSYTDDDRPVPATESNGDYQTMLYQSQSGDVPEPTLQTMENVQQPNVGNRSTPTQGGGQSLDAIAQDLNLSASAKRQLFGRSGKGAAANITTFDTDAEYNANEEFRANQDMQEVRNPVRAIASGKHSLRQLVNSAVGQKDALEDHFATGRRNKREAGSKYGW